MQHAADCRLAAGHACLAVFPGFHQHNGCLLINPSLLHIQCTEVVMRRARTELARLFSKVVQRRRASGEKGNDVLQTFIDSRCTPGCLLCTCLLAF